MTDTLAAVNRRFVKMPTGNIGCPWRNSTAMNAASNTAASANPPSVAIDNQPHSGASMIVNTSAVIAAIDNTMPARSRIATTRKALSVNMPSRRISSSRPASRALSQLNFSCIVIWSICATERVMYCS